MKTVAVLGGGNGAHAAAADLTLKGFKVNLFSLFQQELDPIRQPGRNPANGRSPESVWFRLSCLPRISAKHLEGVDAVLVARSSPGARGICRGMCSASQSGQIVVLNPVPREGLWLSGKFCRTKA